MWNISIVTTKSLTHRYHDCSSFSVQLLLWAASSQSCCVYSTEVFIGSQLPPPPSLLLWAASMCSAFPSCLSLILTRCDFLPSFYVVCNFFPLSISLYSAPEAAGFVLWKVPPVWDFKRWHPREPVRKCEHVLSPFFKFPSSCFDGKHRFSTKRERETVKIITQAEKSSTGFQTRQDFFFESKAKNKLLLFSAEISTGDGLQENAHIWKQFIKPPFFRGD